MKKTFKRYIGATAAAILIAVPVSLSINTSGLRGNIEGDVNPVFVPEDSLTTEKNIKDKTGISVTIPPSSVDHIAEYLDTQIGDEQKIADVAASTAAIMQKQAEDGAEATRLDANDEKVVSQSTVDLSKIDVIAEEYGGVTIEDLKPTQYTMLVKHLLVRSETIDENTTIDSLWAEGLESAGQKVIAMPYGYVPVYTVEGMPEYYVAISDTTVFNGGSQTAVDWQFAEMNTRGLVLDDCFYDAERGLAFIPSRYFDATTDRIESRIVQQELLVPYDLGAEESKSNINVSIIDANDNVAVVSDYYDISVDSVMDRIEIPVVDVAASSSKPDSANDFAVAINQMPLEVTEDNAKYDPDTGVLVINIPPMSISTIDVAVRPDDTFRLPFLSADDTADAWWYADSFNIAGMITGWLASQPVGTKFYYDGWHRYGPTGSYSYGYYPYVYSFAGGTECTDDLGNFFLGRWGNGTWDSLSGWLNDNADGMSFGEMVSPNSMSNYMVCPWPNATLYGWGGSSGSGWTSYSGSGYVAGDGELVLTCSHISHDSETEGLSNGDWYEGTICGNVLARGSDWILVGFVGATGDGQSGVGMVRFAIKPYGSIVVNKLGITQWETADNQYYNNLTSTWRIYRNSACTDLVGTIQTDSWGHGELNDLDPGTYYAKEITPPANFQAISSPIKVTVKAGETSYVYNHMASEYSGEFVHDSPTTYDIKIKKVDSNGNTISGVKFGVWTGGYDNATYGVNGYEDAYDDVGRDVNVNNFEGTFFINTAVGPSVSLDMPEQSVTAGTAVKAYRSNRTPAQIWSFVKRSDGYYYIKNVHSGLILDAEGGSTENGTAVIQWRNNGGTNQQWKIINNGDGTYSFQNRKSGKMLDLFGGGYRDGNDVGIWESNGSAAQKWVLHRADTYLGTITTGSDGIATMTGLPKATYYVKELSVPSPYKLPEDIADRITTIAAGSMGTTKTIVNESGPDLSSKLKKVSETTDPVVLEDTLTFSDFEPGTYTFQGTLMDKSTGETFKVDGQPVRSTTATATATAAQPDGSVTVRFEIPTEALPMGTTTLVAYQTAKKSGSVYAQHNNIKDAQQTVKITRTAKIETLFADADGHKDFPSSGMLNLIDQVEYTVPTKGVEYKLVTTVMDAETGRQLTGTTPITTLFTPSGRTGTKNIPIQLNATGLVGKTIVVYEKLYLGDAVIAVHEDIDDDAQTIVFPKISTSAIDNNTKKRVSSSASTSNTIVDTVTYTDVLPNTAYITKAWLVDKSTGEVIEGSRVTKSFTSKASRSGTVPVNIAIDGTNLKGKTVVVYEELWHGDRLLASHKNINDASQTIHFPEISTVLTGPNGEKTVPYGGTVQLTDKITYSNVVPGIEYTMIGSLMDKDLRRETTAASSVEVKFTPSSSSGTLNMTFSVDTTKLNGAATLVAYEKLMYGTRTLAQHRSLADAAQTVQIVSRGDIELVKYDADTGKSSPQGNGDLSGIKFNIINLTGRTVTSPVDGTTKVPNGGVVCTIATKKVTENGQTVYKASTKFTNTNPKSGGGTWNTPDGWHGALESGGYEVVEVSGPEGYEQGRWANDVKKVWHGIATEDGTGGESGTNIERHRPTNTPKWIEHDRDLVCFDDKTSGPNDTVKRGDIELIKYDDTTDKSGPQGNATLEGVQFNIINRSENAVLSPEDGTTLIEPDHVVCRITAKKVGNVYKASTKATGTNQKKSGSGTWNTPSDWHGALAYGEYEVVEVKTSTGYLLGAWTGNDQEVFHGVATVNGRCEQSWHGDNGKKFTPSGTPAWINADKALVKFDDATHGASNTVMRGDIELVKYDSDLNKSQAQGDATLEGVQFDIINRSQDKVVSPEDGTTEIAPGEVVCRITTKKITENGQTVYKASTSFANNQKRTGSGTWTTKSAWHGALAYGEYEVVEVKSSDGYLLGALNGDALKVWHGFATINSAYDEQWLRPNGQAFKPSSTPYWINADRVVVKFNTVGHAPENTVKRGDIELIKYDDQIKRSAPQGDADLEGIQFAIINRSAQSVQSPENPSELVEPGHEVCRIMTKKEVVNGQTVYRASTQTKNYNKTRNGSGTWNTPVANGSTVECNWHGALAYGSYQVVELSPDGKYVGTGYMFGVWTGNTQKIWHGNAAGTKWNNNWLNIAANSNIITNNTFNYTTANGQKFDPDTSSRKWIDDDKVLVTFDDQPNGPNNSVQRGDIELIKSDDNWNDSRLQGDATLAGAVFEIYNASAALVVSPQTLQEVEPGGLVCTIKTFKDTDGRYKATTECPAGSLAAQANGWSIPASYGYFEPDGHGHALPYGQYVVVEKDPSLGYMLNSEWVGRAINNDNVHGEIQFSVTNGNVFTLAGKTSNASATPTWVNEQGALVKFDNKTANEGKSSQEHYHSGDAVPQVGESLDTVDRENETWCEDTIFRAGIRIGKVDRQNADYKPQGAATLETAIIEVSSLCDNPIWTLKGTYANGSVPVWGEVEAWTGANRTSHKDGVPFLNIVVRKVTKADGTVQYYASTRDDKGVAGVDFDDGALDLTLPYGRYMLRELSVDSADPIYGNLTSVNSGYMFDTISQNWRRQFSIGYDVNTKHPALTYYNETGGFLTLVQGDSIADPTAVRVTPTDTVVYDRADNHPVGNGQTVNANHGKILDMTAASEAIPNLVARFDIEFIKKDEDSKLLAGAVFLITSKTTGETHVAVTDENGKFSSVPENQIRWHTKKETIGTVNGNDEGILTQASDAGITYLNISTDEQGQLVVDYDTGIATQENAEGKAIIDSTNAKIGNGIWFYGRTDKKTYDPATATGNGAGGETGNVNEDTTVYISAVRPPDIQMVRNDIGAFPYDDYIVQELPTANTVDYIMTHFEIHMKQATKDAPSDGLKNRIEMELKSPDPVLLMEYPQYFDRIPIDAGTVTDIPQPEIHTTLVNTDEVQVAKAIENYTLIDKVEWFHLKNGHKYKLHGELWLKDENDQIVGTEPFAVKDQTFIAHGHEAGLERMSFENLNLRELGGKALVAFEYLYDTDNEEEPLLVHADPNDDDQTVPIPEIGTTLVDSDGDKEVAAYKEIKLIDHVEYEGLKPNQTYTFTGTLHIQQIDENGNITDGGVATDASGNPLTASKDVLIETRNGVVDVEFTFMAPDLAGKRVVAFEDVKMLDYVFATHTEISDVPQTVYFPEIQTTALDGITGDHIGLADGVVTVKDIVSYKNLVKGKSYEVDGTFMNRDTGEPIKNADGTDVVGTLTFVAGAEEGAVTTQLGDIELVSGIVEVPFTVSADVLRGVKGVVFEKLYTGDGGHDVEISKTDAATSKELPGAKLIVKKGESIVAAWTSTDTPHKVKLDEGTYTLTEITAPAGYEVAETIEFTVDANGLVGSDKVEMKDQPLPEEEGKEVEISKTDATTSKELPGATLVVAKDGKTVASWVSTDTPHKVKLPEGTYTLTEITAPYGYDVAETITFTVDENGLVGSDKIEMKDAPSSNPEIEISKTDAATTQEIPGATLIIQKDGQLVETWVSTDTPHKVKLPEGTYTLTEITAPYGYDIAESITFKVGADGLVDGDKVEMKDVPKEPVAIHEDINDEGQSVTYPEIQTEAHVDGAKAAVTAAGEVHLIDVVSYKNLIPGREYVMQGLLMDKVTGQPALTPEGQQITAQAAFVPETASGVMEMEFVFNAHALEFHDVVVFENAYVAKSGVADNLIHVAKHEDINDIAQTVGFGEDDIADMPIQSTGDDMPFIPLLITVGVAFGAASAFGLRRRFMR